jgi:hypothetical protein
MALPSKNADLYRRIRLYVFGLLLGIVVVKFAYKGKACQMPGSAKLEELREQKRETSDLLQCQLKHYSITNEEINSLMHTGKVNFDKSDVRQKPCGIYIVEGSIKPGTNVELKISDCDTLSTFISLKVLGMPNDSCK